jgi:DNA invertase Pin-like site-specific DNA recombinase
MKRVALYARVSTGGQTVNNQIRELEAVGKRLGWNMVERYIDEGISGSKGRDERPALNEMLKAVIRREVDLVAAWSVDRLGRSLQELIAILSDLREREVDLYLHQQGLDTATPSGRAMYQMLGVFAEFERAIIVERIKSGMARAKQEGKRLSRPLTPEEIQERIRELRAEGHSLRWIGEELGVSKSTVANYVKGMGKKKKEKAAGR